MKKRTPATPSKPRRAVLQSPKLGKGGVHGKTRKAERRGAKTRLARDEDH